MSTAPELAGLDFTSDDAILTDIAGYIKRFVMLPDDHQYEVIAAWVIHSWAFEAAHTTPYLYVHSPEAQSGKSLLIDVLASIVQNPMTTIDATGPVLFRAIDQITPTLLFDEVDAIWSGSKNEGLRGILNGGYKQGGHVYRLDKQEPVKFNTFCPKLLAGIHNGHLPATLVDRCIPITMRRKQVSTRVEPFMSSELDGTIEGILDRVEAWVTVHLPALKEYRQHPVDGLSDRQAEIAWPLLAIANEFGGVDRLSMAIVEMIGTYHELTDETDHMLELLRNVGLLFEAYGRGKLHTAELLDGLDMKPKESIRLAKYLETYNIRPKRVRVGNRVAKGYDIDQFEPLFRMHDIAVTV